ncbi:MAG: transcription-repair coupling factor [Bacteroidales bacterium]|jgi:transcription-repair coupling factor (superfamily II helicase)|nr:transcription-repair coupling factor [Bacteroidales bacterium]
MEQGNINTIRKNQTDILLNYPDIKSFITDATKPHANIAISGLRGSALAFFVSAVARNVAEFKHIVCLKDYQQAASCYNDLSYAGGAMFFGNPMEAQTLTELEESNCNVVVTYYDCLFEKIAAKTSVKQNSLRLVKNQVLDFNFLIDELENLHFERQDFVFEPGQYALRGGIIDIFSYSEPSPCRLELFGENLESIRSFDVVSQLSIEEKPSFLIVPNVKDEDLFEPNATLIDYFEGINALIWVDKFAELQKKAAEFDIVGEKVVNNILNSNLIRIEANNNADQTGSSPTLSFDYHTDLQPHFNQSLELLFANLVSFYEKGFSLFVSVTDKKQEERLKAVFEQYIEKNEEINELPVDYIDFSFAFGFIDYDRKILLYTDHQIFSRVKNFNVNENAARQRESLMIEDLTTLKVGDYVTHIDYGVGRFAGLEKISGISGRQQESIRLIYKDGDVLYVSIHALHKISRYVGNEGSVPKVHRLGSKAWENLKEKTKSKVKDIARDLILLYADRKRSSGFAFSADNYLQNSLEASFIYEDTPDQRKASVAVKKDMESSYPMDRLVCGDVGFGKTEIAIRAAFKAACDSKQTAVLVPTTILALQHFKTFSERLKDMPVRIDFLNRFRSAKEKKQILADLRDGKIDIIIGTHALVGSKANGKEMFKDLGLLIIDEEHKFGVSVKEKLKKIKVNVDTLTLTATPIPRTLQFSLMGARDLSIINTPPPNRIPIQTQIATFDEMLIKQSIEYELNRNGQVFFVNDKIMGLEQLKQVVEKNVPQAKVRIAHSQLPNEELEEIMLSFIEGEFDVLVSTTIVENGLDVSNANTIIINHAQNYGLSDLHQLRGRVGRTNRRAFCYLLCNEKEILTEQASKRLKAIEEFTSLGSGFSIAMRDLDIRGAGNLLGSEQSGFINEVGFETYNKILNEAIEELRLETGVTNEAEYPTIETDCTIETDLEALIPDNYISNTTERLKIYKELDSITTEKHLQRLALELKDRFGTIPKETLLLFDIVRLRWMAKSKSVEKLILKNERLSIYFIGSDKSNFYNTDAFSRFLQLAQGRPTTCKLKEEGNRLIATFSNVKQISDAISLINF